MRAPRLIRSGWWVAAAAVLLTAAVAWVLIAPLLERHGSGAPPPSFTLETATVPRELIVRGMEVGRVHTLHLPATMTPEEVELTNEEERGKLLVPDDRVIGVEIGNEARAYPLRLMRWHELVNDEVGGEPIAVTYSPLCDSVAVYGRRRGGAILELGVSGLLYNSNTLLYELRDDPDTSPLWTQIGGVPVAGPDPEGTPPLERRPATLTTWAEWRSRHPETRVLAPVAEQKPMYTRDPYHSYFGSDLLRFPVSPLPTENGLALKDRLVVVEIDGAVAAWALPDLADAGGSPDGAVTVDVAGRRLEVRYRLVPGTAVVAPADGGGGPQSVRYGFWFAWYSIERTIPGMIPGAVSVD